MCGRFCLTAEMVDITHAFAVKQNVVLTKRYNIAPAQVVLAIKTPGMLDFLTWGFAPKWLKEGQNPFINARAETLFDKPAFKSAILHRRCLILATGYYEWKQIGNHKQPYHFSLSNNQLFAFAGLYDGDTCAIITTNATQKEMLVIHERAPLTLPSNLYDVWLNPKANKDDILTCLNTKHLHFNISAVTTKVNNPKNDVIECIKALH